MITYIKGDLFSHATQAPYRILAHACNCRGSWGAGIARAFREKLPSTYAPHVKHCNERKETPSPLLGTTQLIYSRETIPSLGSEHNKTLSIVACLFTSDFAGTKKLPPHEIVKYTRLALQDLEQKLEACEHADTLERDENSAIVVNMPKINAGLFAVPWEETEAVLQEFPSLSFNVYVLE